jgi:signal transduction histidine kinase
VVTLETFAEMSAALRDPLYVVDDEERIIHFNPAFYGLFPRTIARGLKRMRCTEALAFAPCQEGGSCLRAQCAASGPVRLDEIVVDIGGQSLRMHITAMPVALSEGRSGAAIMLRDVTDETRVQEKYQAMVDEVRRQAEVSASIRAETERLRRDALGQLVAGVAHEVNTPIGVANAAVASLSEIMAQQRASPGAVQSEDDEDIEKALSLIQRSLERVDRLVKRFKKLSEGQLSDALETLDLAQLVREVVGLWQLEGERAGIAVEVHANLAPEATRWVGYAGHLSQVLLNLLANVKAHAYRAGEYGRVDVNVLSRVSAGAAEFQIDVVDHGVGIAPENLPRIWDAFFTTSRGKGNAGLGLPITYNIVTAALGGEITCKSEPGKGATFSVIFKDRAAASPA